MISIFNLVIAILEIVLGCGFIGFWIIFYFTEYKNPTIDEVFFTHEKTFPLPDLGWVTPCLFISGISILLNQDFGFFFAALAGSGMMFLGLIDLAYDIQNRFYTPLGVLIILIMLIGGPILIILAWINLL
ncbi:MAG: hypothetical protein GF383_13280 [Candidatus Lokiarchaeota archaeon]|nr:hypothetical protein [Candidatus Lokiarchaeota archaeon]MBD3342146.1 hypothetical protein [Candidatus Lokiarchaeota archaeon]